MNRYGEPWSKDALRLAVSHLCRRAGLVADRRGERVVAYTMRHTSATAAAAAGVGDALLGAIMGHSTPRMTRRYCHITRQMARKGMERWLKAKEADRRKNGRLGSRRTRPDGER